MEELEKFFDKPDYRWKRTITREEEEYINNWICFSALIKTRFYDKISKDLAVQKNINIKKEINRNKKDHLKRKKFKKVKNFKRCRGKKGSYIRKFKH